MAPDKIYVREYPDGINQFWDRKKRDDVVATIHHEYIRKDALMEWLEECKDNPVITDLQKGNIQELIDKLNSM